MTTQTGSISFESAGGLQSYAKQNYATLSQIKGQFATCGTGASTAAKVATIVPTNSNWTLYEGATVTVKFTSENTTTAPTLNVNSTGAKPIKDYAGNTLTSAAYNWPEGAAMALTYDGSSWRIQDSNLMERVHGAETAIDQTATSITSLASMQDTYTKPDGTSGTNSMKTYVDQTAEGINTTISGMQTDISNKADGSTVTTLSNTVNNISDTVSGHTQSISSINSTITTKVDKSAAIVETIQLWYSKANTTAPDKPTAQVTSTSTDGNAWRTVVPAYNSSYPNYFYCYQWKYADGNYGWSAVTHDIAMGETQERARTAITNAATAQTTANANIKSSVMLWFTKADMVAPNKPTAQVTTSDAAVGNAWSLVVPTYNSSYPYYFYCYQQQKGDGNYQWSDVIYDRATTESQDTARAASSSLANYITTNNATLQSLQNQVDGQIEAWYMSVDPTTSNEPASDWITDTLKARHEGDLYYNITNGHSWRWLKNNNTYSWQQIPDSDAAAALTAAQNAQSTANGKRRIFTAQPTTPYDEGDLWVDGSQVKYATVARTSGNYVAADWEQTATDDTVANAAQATADKNVKESIQLWFTKANTTAPNQPTAVVNNNSPTGANSYNQWNIAVPVYNETYPYYYYCYQWKLADDTYTWSSVVYDQATTENQANSRAAKTLAESTQTDYAEFKQTMTTFQSTVGTTYATKTELGTETSSRESAIQQVNSAISAKANSSDVYTKTDVDDLIAQEIIDRDAAITVSANGITSSVSETYATKSTVNGIESRVSTAESTITQHATDIEAKVSKDGVIAAINLSTEQESGSSAKISADKVNIEGAAIFSSGRLSTTSLNNTYATSSTVNTANATEETLYYASNSTTAPAIPTSAVSTNSATTYDAWNLTLPTYSSSYPYLFTCLQRKSIGNTYSWTKVMQSSYAQWVNSINTTANNAAPKSDAVSRTQRIYYRQTAAGAKPGINETWLATSGTGYGNWSLTVPQLTSGSTKYPKLYTAVQTQTVAQQAAGSACSCSPVQLDDSTTIIDGGNIITGTISTNSIDASSGTFDTANIPNLSADKITSGSIAAERIQGNVISAVNNGTGTINADKINATNLHVNAANIDGTITFGQLSGVQAEGSYATTTQLTTETNQRKAQYGTCDTAAATQVKVVTCANFELVAGNELTVKFSTANTYASGAVQLNVNSEGAKNVWVGNAVTSTTNKLLWGADAYITFRYDGTQFIVIGEPRTWYGACTTLEATPTKTDTTAVTGCVICKGTKVELAMTNANSADNPTLNIQSTGALAIYFGSGSIRPTKANSTSWLADSTCTFTFDGAAWRTQGKTYIDANSIVTGYISADRIEAGSLGVGKIDATSGTFDTANIPNLNANKINAGTLNISVIPSGALNSELTSDINNAAATATTYITDIDTNKGITIKPSDSSGNDYLQMNSTDIRFVRNNVDVMNLTDSSFRIGSASGYHSTINTSGLHIWSGAESTATNEVASFGSTARVGKTNSSRFLMNADSLQAYNSSNTKYFEVSANGLTWGNNTAATTTSVSEANNAANTIVTVYPTTIDYAAGTATLAVKCMRGTTAVTPSAYLWTKGTTSTSIGTNSTLSVTDLDAVYNCTVTIAV